MFSQVTSNFGYKLPAKALCALARENGIFSIVDGAQVVGQLPVDVKDLDCDAFVSSPHKWLLAPKGTGILYIRRERQDEIWTTLASYNYDNYEDGAFRFMQYGTGSPAVIFGLQAALEFNRKIGIERIARWNFELTKQLQEGLAKIPGVRNYSGDKPELWAGATTFGLSNKTSAELQDALWEQKIRVRGQGDNNRARGLVGIVATGARFAVAAAAAARRKDERRRRQQHEGQVDQPLSDHGHCPSLIWKRPL